MMMRMPRWLYTLHLWVGVAVGAQLLLWTASGLFMTSSAIETVRGEHLRREAVPADLRQAEGVLPLAKVLAVQARVVDEIALTSLLGQPVYRLKEGKAVWLADARTGATRTLNGAEAIALARAATVLDGPATASALDPATPPLDFRRNVPGWQVTFADGTRVYVGAAGEILAVRTKLWRLYDFAWGLHIMDPGGREDTHHPLLIGSAGLALVSVLSGLVLIVLHFRRRWA